ncbi:MAG TPA: Arc family DNA-binding protein [Arsenophonus apicola]|uniref:Arc family DNA-binding protein n=1 Tax=Arsenophonus apicola TaxID=2879119 RepID=UPI00387A4267
MSERKYKNPQVNLRLPVELKNRINELANVNGRSANQEMVAAIEAWVKQNKNVKELTISDLTNRIIALENQIQTLKNNLEK